MSAIASPITRDSIIYSTVFFRRGPKKTSKLHVIGLCEGNAPMTGEFPAQRASNAGNVFISWRSEDIFVLLGTKFHQPVIFQCGWMLKNTNTYLMFLVFLDFFCWKCSIQVCHDGVIIDKRFPHCWSFVSRIHWWSAGSPHKNRHWYFSADSLTSCWTNSWVFGDLRRHDAHVTLLLCHDDTYPYSMFQCWLAPPS